MHYCSVNELDVMHTCGAYGRERTQVMTNDNLTNRTDKIFGGRAHQKVNFMEIRKRDICLQHFSKALITHPIYGEISMFVAFGGALAR